MKPYGQISAAELAERSGVARSTVYRRWAGLDDLFWNFVRPHWEVVIKAVLTGSNHRALATLREIQPLQGHREAIGDQRLAESVTSKLATLFACEMDRIGQKDHAHAFGLVAASSLMRFLALPADRHVVDETEARHLINLLYSAARPQRKSTRALAPPRGQFPAAVSHQESLACDDYIVSMIDGRPYRSLKRHLARFGMTPDMYRRCFALPADYPMVAKSYSDVRRSLARQLFAGRRDRMRSFAKQEPALV